MHHRFAVLFSWLCCVSMSAAAAENRPNILFVFTDDHACQSSRPATRSVSDAVPADCIRRIRKCRNSTTLKYCQSLFLEQASGEHWAYAARLA